MRVDRGKRYFIVGKVLPEAEIEKGNTRGIKVTKVHLNAGSRGRESRSMTNLSPNSRRILTTVRGGI